MKIVNRLLFIAIALCALHIHNQSIEIAVNNATTEQSFFRDQQRSNDYSNAYNHCSEMYNDLIAIDTCRNNSFVSIYRNP